MAGVLSGMGRNGPCESVVGGYGNGLIRAAPTVRNIHGPVRRNLDMSVNAGTLGEVVNGNTRGRRFRPPSSLRAQKAVAMSWEQ